MESNAFIKFPKQSDSRNNILKWAGIYENYELQHADNREPIPSGYGVTYFNGWNPENESGTTPHANTDCCGSGDGDGGDSSTNSFPSIDKPSPLAPCNELISIEKINEIIERNDNICDVKNVFLSGVAGFSQNGADLDINITCVGECVLPPEVCPKITDQFIGIYVNGGTSACNAIVPNSTLVYAKNVVNPVADLEVAKSIADSLFSSHYPPAMLSIYCGGQVQDSNLTRAESRKRNDLFINIINGCVRGIIGHHTQDYLCTYDAYYANEDTGGLECQCYWYLVRVTVDNGHIDNEFNHTQINPPLILRKEVLNFRNGIFYDACNEMNLIKCKSIYDSEGKEYVVRADSISDLNKLLPFLEKDSTLYGMSNTITIKSEIGIVVINGMTGEVLYSIKNEGRRIN